MIVSIQIQRFTNGEATFRCPSCKMTVNLGENGTLDKLGANTFYNILESSGGSSAGGGGGVNDGLGPRVPNKLHNGGGGGRDLSIPGWTPSKELQADPAWPLGGGGIWNNRQADSMCVGLPLRRHTIGVQLYNYNWSNLITIYARTPLLGSGGGGNDTAWKPLSNNGGGGGGEGGPTESSNGPPVTSLPWGSSPVICQPPQTNAFGFPSSGIIHI